METKLLYNLHHEHKEWLNKLLFYRDKLKLMRNQLEKAAKKKLSKESLAFLDHFENQIHIHNTEIGILNHDIRTFEKKLEESAHSMPIAVDMRQVYSRPNFNEKLERFEKLFNDLRKELFSFLAKVM